MSQFNLSNLKRSQLVIIPAILAAYSMGGKETFLGMNSEQVFVVLLAVVVINLIFECRKMGKDD
ncbi:MAG: hypothetical protein GJ671_01775 [Alteromonadaceae bacterium]|nr:hypothetical protein [Alteromonadaceae bacterium]